MTTSDLEAGRAQGRFRTARWLIVLAAALVVLAVGAVVALKLLFPPEKLRAMVVPRLEAAVGREVELSTVRLRVFPRLAVRLEELAIADPPAFGDEPMLELEALELQARLLPLLRRQLELGEVRLIRPRIRYVVLADGTSNFAGLGAGEGGADASAGGGAAAAGLIVNDLELRDGTVLYVDRGPGRAVRFGLEAGVTAERTEEGRGLTSRGELRLRSIAALLPALAPDTVPLPDIVLDYDLLADLAGDSVALRELAATIGDVPLDGSGVVRDLDGERMLDFRMESGAIDIARVLASVPGERAAAVRARGDARVTLTAAGPLAGEAPPTVRAEVELAGLTADYVGVDGLLADGSGSVRVASGAGTTSLTIPSFDARLMGRPLRLRLSIPDLAEMVVDGHVQGALDLAQAAALRGAATPLSGIVGFELGVAGPVRDPARLRLTGPLRLENVSYRSGALAVPVRVASGTVRLNGADVRIDELPVTLGRSDITLSLSGRRVLPLLLSRGEADVTPTVEFQATSRILDMGELLADTTGRVGYSRLLAARLAGRKLDGRDPADIARERYGALPVPPVQATGRVTIDKLVNPPTTARAVAFVLTLQDGRLQVSDLRGQVYGGSLAGALTLDARGGTPPFPLAYELSLSRAQAGPFVNRWTRLGSALSGTVDFNVSGSTTVDESLLPAPEGTSARGRAAFRDGGFQEFALTRALTNRLNFTPDFLTHFRQFGGPFRIENGAFLLERWNLTGGDLSATLSGAAGLGGALDLSVSMNVPPSLLGKAGLVKGADAGPLGDLLGQLAGEDTQPLQVSLGIGGTMSDPRVQLDTEALQAQLQKRLEGKGKDLLKRLFKPPN